MIFEKRFESGADVCRAFATVIAPTQYFALADTVGLNRTSIVSGRFFSDEIKISPSLVSSLETPKN
jgi:hypothetical protein